MTGHDGFDGFTMRLDAFGWSLHGAVLGSRSRASLCTPMLCAGAPVESFAMITRGVDRCVAAYSGQVGLRHVGHELREHDALDEPSWILALPAPSKEEGIFG